MVSFPINAPIALEMDEEYQAAVRHLQVGEWDQALQVLANLRQKYPQRSELQALEEHARLKANLERRRPAGGLRRLLPQVMPLLRRLLMAGMALLAMAAVVLAYTRLIAPAQAEQARVSEQARLLQEGQQALVVGAYARAADAFRKLLEQAPDSIPAREGLAIAEERLALAERYEAAVALEQAGDTQGALEAFQELYAEAPDYADVAQRIDALRRRSEVGRAYDEATQAFAARQWAAAAAAYEAVRNLDLEFRKDEVANRLFESYINQAMALAQQPDVASDGEGVADQAVALLNRALSLRPRDTKASTLRNQLASYVQGRMHLQAGEWDAAARYLEPVYAQAPHLLAGAVAEGLYRAYLEQGKAYEAAEQFDLAIERYRRAADLAVTDVSEARAAIERLTPLTIPTATPTPPPEPTATPTPTPTPLPLAAYQGWIAFRTDRNGVDEVYVMRPDGSDARPVSDPGFLAKMEEREAYSPDGTRRVYNEGDKNSTPLYVWRYDLPSNWQLRRQLLDNSSINYQPAWSPLGDLIAFTSQKTGNDEIWVISAEEGEERPQPRQLTFNDWQWDKHPTWSPDGQFIAFWSNREGGNWQIWIMRRDGSEQRNISANQYNDWDPVWIKASNLVQP
jgi:tetratricopeptide (TPR) repeat protein